jgi:hypothetical protein
LNTNNQEIQCDLLSSSYSQSPEKAHDRSNNPSKAHYKKTSPEKHVFHISSKEVGMKNPSYIIRGAENEKSEIDIDEYLLGSKQEESVNNIRGMTDHLSKNTQKVNNPNDDSYQKYVEGKYHSNIEVDLYENISNGQETMDGLQPKVVSGHHLHPSSMRSSTFQENQIKPINKQYDK